jgi:hypothetical protein
MAPSNEAATVVASNNRLNENCQTAVPPGFGAELRLTVNLHKTRAARTRPYSENWAAKYNVTSARKLSIRGGD